MKLTGTKNQRIVPTGIIVFCLAIFPVCQHAAAQSANTPNTLKLDHPDNMPAAEIEQVAWIAGHYQAEAFGGIAVENWLPPFGGSMMGMFKLAKGDSVIFYEFFIIARQSNSLVLKLKHFHPDLRGWEEKDESISFPLVKMEKNAAYFDGITYQKINEDTLRVYLAMRQRGKTTEAMFEYKRVKTDLSDY